MISPIQAVPLDLHDASGPPGPGRTSASSRKLFTNCRPKPPCDVSRHENFRAGSACVAIFPGIVSGDAKLPRRRVDVSEAQAHSSLDAPTTNTFSLSCVRPKLSHPPFAGSVLMRQPPAGYDILGKFPAVYFQSGG